jgi:hypothetical protein
MSKEKPAKKAKRQPDDLTSLTVKVPDSLRVHWLIKAKQSGTNLSAVIVEHLTKIYGKPE